jgi:hypothetical protein
MNLYAQLRLCQPLLDPVYLRYLRAHQLPKSLKLFACPIYRWWRLHAFLDYYRVRIVEIGDFGARIEGDPTLVAAEASHRRLSSHEIEPSEGTQALEVLLEV